MGRPSAGEPYPLPFLLLLFASWLHLIITPNTASKLILAFVAIKCKQENSSHWPCTNGAYPPTRLKVSGPLARLCLYAFCQSASGVKCSGDGFHYTNCCERMFSRPFYRTADFLIFTETVDTRTVIALARVLGSCFFENRRESFSKNFHLCYLSWLCRKVRNLARQLSFQVLVVGVKLIDKLTTLCLHLTHFSLILPWMDLDVSLPIRRFLFLRHTGIAHSLTVHFAFYSINYWVFPLGSGFLLSCLSPCCSFHFANLPVS